MAGVNADELRAWNEYLSWARGADPTEYARTEALAWQRLERVLMVRRLAEELEPDAVAPPSIEQ